MFSLSFSKMSAEEPPILEEKVQIEDCGIGYQRYGYGPESFIFICGGVGKVLTEGF